MLTRKVFVLLSAGAAMIAVLPPAHALTATSPLQAGATLTNTASNINFQGFSNNFKTANSIPLNAVLNSVEITAKGTAAGSVTISQFNPTGAASVTSPGSFLISVNSVTPVGQSNANLSGTVPAAQLLPVYAESTFASTITATSHTYRFFIAPGGTQPPSYFLNDSLALAALSDFIPVIGGTGGASETQDNSTFALSSTLSDTFLTFNYQLADVPAPLPVLGAVSAFGFSRRLRRRIKASA